MNKPVLIAAAILLAAVFLFSTGYHYGKVGERARWEAKVNRLVKERMSTLESELRSKFEKDLEVAKKSASVREASKGTQHEIRDADLGNTVLDDEWVRLHDRAAGAATAGDAHGRSDGSASASVPAKRGK